MLICPYCNKSGHLAFLANINIMLWQDKEGKFLPDWDQASENDDNSFVPVSFRAKEFVLTKKKKIDVICFSDKCEGKEMTIDLLVDDEELAHKSW